MDLLEPLPIEALRLPPETVNVLHQLGIVAIGQLMSLPRDALASRFGPEVLRRLGQLAGRVDEPMVSCRPAPEFVVAQALEHPTSRRNILEQLVMEMVGRLAEYLARHDRGALRLECVLRLEGKTDAPARITVGLYQATASAKHLFELVWMQVERQKLPSAVAAVRLEATGTAALDQRQQELFDDMAVRRERHLAGLVDRLAGRLGRRAVLRPRLVRGAQPELAYRYEPLVDSAAGRRAGRNALAKVTPPRPLRLRSRPMPVPVTSLAPEGPPLEFTLAGRRHRVAHAWGPERIETGWWRGRHVGRDYYRVETADGRRWWLFRRLRDARWFLHGVFY